MRVGVTGHRKYDDPDAVAERTRAAIDRICAGYDPADVEVWSGLAEGADRLVAGMMLARGAALVAVLPLSADDYRVDFTGPASATEFDTLLASARDVRVARAGEPGREAAYEAAGVEMLDAVDVVIALWDGAPSRGRGGTAEIVAEARRRCREVVIVHVTRDNVGR